MTFPKAPKKSIRGNLKLIVRNPTTEVSVGEVEPDYGPDLSSDLSFRLPRGFGVDEDYKGVLVRMYQAALKRVGEIEFKSKKCKNCRKITDPSTISTSKRLLEESHIFLTEFQAEGVSYTVGHSVEGSIIIEYRKDNLTLFISVSDSVIEVGKFVGSKLIESREDWATALNLLLNLKWLIGV